MISLLVNFARRKTVRKLPLVLVLEWKESASIQAASALNINGVQKELFKYIFVKTKYSHSFLCFTNRFHKSNLCFKKLILS